MLTFPKLSHRFHKRTRLDPQDYASTNARAHNQGGAVIYVRFYCTSHYSEYISFAE